MANMGRDLDFLTRMNGIDVKSDIGDSGRTAQVVVGENDSPIQRIIKDGAEYDFIQIDYLDNERLAASRKIARVFAGKRTELAYWALSAPHKELSVHRGIGSLVVATAVNGPVEKFRLDRAFTRHVTLPPGTFYTFEGDSWGTISPLVVSGYYEPPVASWEDVEVVIPKGATHISVPREGEVEVPQEFVARYAA